MVEEEPRNSEYKVDKIEAWWGHKKERERGKKGRREGGLKIPNLE